MLKQPPNYTHTLNPDWDICADELTRLIRHYYAKLDRLCLGKHWSRFPSCQRITGVLFVASSESTHAHGLIHVPEQHIETVAEKQQEIWRKLVGRGTTDFTKLETEPRWNNYCYQQMLNGDVILLEQLHSSPD